MSPTVKRFSMAAVLLALAGCMSQTAERSKGEARRFFAIVDTAGATGRDSVLLTKLPCSNPTAVTRTLTVTPGDPDTVLEVEWNRLEIPRGAVTLQETTFTMTHAADPKELRVEVTSSPKINVFTPRLTLALSYRSCDTTGVDLESVHVLRNDLYDRGGKHDPARRAIRAQLPDLSTYTLVVP